METWLSPDIPNADLDIEGYHIVRYDRNRHGGGVLLYVSNAITCKVLPQCDGLELLSIVITGNNCKACVTLFYRPPNSSTAIFDILFSYLESLDISQFSNFIMIGDFNVDVSNHSHPLFPKLRDMSASFDLQQMVTEPTHIHGNGSSIIDHVYTSNSLLIKSCVTIPPLSTADHNGLLAKVLWRASGSLNSPNNSKGRVVWLYAHADWSKTCDMIENFDWNSIMCDNIDLSWSNWHDQFLKILEECIPKRSLPQRRNLPWLSKKLVTTMKRRNLLFRRAKKTGNFLKYKSLRNKLVSEFRKAKSAYFGRLNPKNPKDFWRTVKYLNKKQSTIPTLVSETLEANSGIEKANMLNSFFSKCFNQSTRPLSDNDCDQLRSSCDVCPDELLCDESAICGMLESLDVSKSNGPDGVSSRMLKSTAAHIAPSITKLFNQSIKSGRIPSEWKSSFVVPISKGGDIHNPGNYRPISLLPVISKLLEKHIQGLLLDHLDVYSPLSNQQWGFTTGRSTVTALIATVNEWLKILEDGLEVCAVFLDYRKAFDSVPHRMLIAKLEELHLDPYLISWVADYLSARIQQVVVDGSISDPTPVLSGVPQGSILGPLLFLIYVNSITEVDVSPLVRCILYADDVLLYCPVGSQSDYAVLQNDINAITEWSDHHYLALNAAKCKYMIISRKRVRNDPTLPLTLNGVALEKVDTFKYLGVLLSNNLSWTNHISNACTKARKILGLLYRRFYNHASNDSIRQLYLSLARPHLEYAAALWDPHTVKDVQLLENTQKFALKLITRNWDSSYQDLLALADLPSLSSRRLHVKLSQLYRIVHGLCYFPEGIVQMRPSQSERLQRSLTIFQPFARTNAYLMSFLPNSISAWNSLTEEQVTCSTLSSFKKSLL